MQFVTSPEIFLGNHLVLTGYGDETVPIHGHLLRYSFTLKHIGEWNATAMAINSSDPSRNDAETEKIPVLVKGIGS